VGFPLRCFQRLSRPYIAMQHCRWRDNCSTRGTFIPVLSIGQILSKFQHPRQIGTELSHDVLNSSRTTLIGNSEPLDFSSPGCDEPTSRCQTTPSIWTLGRHQPVIPGVLLSVSDGPSTRDHRITMPTSSLLDLLVSQSAGLCHYTRRRFPTVLSLPSHASVTLWEATAPVKLPPCAVPVPDKGRG